jgi:hypothetical protein
MRLELEILVTSTQQDKSSLLVRDQSRDSGAYCSSLEMNFLPAGSKRTENKNTRFEHPNNNEGHKTI